MAKPPRHRNSPGNKSPSNNAKRSPHHNNSHAATVAAASPGRAKTAQHQQQQSYKAVISSNSSIGSAPSAVMCVPASPLARELSDLSGSYMNGNTAPRGTQNRSFGNSVCSEEPVQGFWRQAYLLSSPCPREHPPAPPAPSSSPPSSPARRGSGSALIVVERNGVIELVKKSDGGSSSGGSGSGEEDKHKQEKNNKTSSNSSSGSSSSSQHDKNDSNNTPKSFLHDSLESTEDNLMFLAHLPAQNNTSDSFDDPSSSRIPILILLMDPGRKQYEIMQLWVDPRTDLVRDILLALQRKLSDKWRQDYDGLFQLRGNQYCQLVHILSIAKYDCKPRELWVAKPWSMAAKTTIELANDCVQQLKASGLVSNYASNSLGKKRIKKFLRSGRSSPTSEEDGPLTLSDEALKRMWFPDGIMKHHHACQFLSFRVPAIPSRVVGQPLTARNVPPGGGSNRGFLGSLLYASHSFDDASSQLSNPSDVMLLGETPTKLNSSSGSAASPSSGRRKRQGYSRQQRLPTPVNLDSKWQPSGPLEDVAEVIVNTSAKDHHSNDLEDAPDVSTILADLETTNNNNVSELNEMHEMGRADEPQQPELLQTKTKKEQRCSLWTLFAPLNCAKRRSLTGGSRKGDDGYSSSWGGDGSSSGAKTSKNSKNSKNSNNFSYNEDGRESPTSKGSGDCDDANDEDASIVYDDSAPLLSTLPRTSSSGSVNRHQQQPFSEQALQAQSSIAPAHQAASPSPFEPYYK